MRCGTTPRHGSATGDQRRAACDGPLERRVPMGHRRPMGEACRPGVRRAGGSERARARQASINRRRTPWPQHIIPPPLLKLQVAKERAASMEVSSFMDVQDVPGLAKLQVSIGHMAARSGRQARWHAGWLTGWLARACRAHRPRRHGGGGSDDGGVCVGRGGGRGSTLVAPT